MTLRFLWGFFFAVAIVDFCLPPIFISYSQRSLYAMYIQFSYELFFCPSLVEFLAFALQV